MGEIFHQCDSRTDGEFNLSATPFPCHPKVYRSRINRAKVVPFFFMDHAVVVAMRAHALKYFLGNEARGFP